MDILQRALREALDRNAAETVRWTQYKEQHETAKANIEEFKKSLEVDIMVPIGTKALMPGRLYHTNEIMVSHSATYYSKCTAHKAVAICQNRLNLAATRLKALEDEAYLHRNQLELPQNFDAFSSQEIIETYNEEEEKKWQVDHNRKMKEHKRKEALQRQQLTNGNGEDDIMKKLEELELMEELENELEAMSEEDDESVQAILNERGKVEQTTNKKRISHFNERNNEQEHKEHISSSNVLDNDGGDVDDDDDDDDDIPAEYKEFERRTESMTKEEKLKTFKKKLDEVQDYVRNCRPHTIEDISHKTDMMFLADHLLNAIEVIEDELNCERYLNGENFIAEDSEDADIPAPKTILKKSNSLTKDNRQSDSRGKLSSTKKITFAATDEVKEFRENPHEFFSNNALEEIEGKLNCKGRLNGENFATENDDVIPTTVPKGTKPILKKSLIRVDRHVDTTDQVREFSKEPNKIFSKKNSTQEEPNKLFSKKISFASEDDVKSFHHREEPIKISSSVIFDHGPVLLLNVNHSEAVFDHNSANEQSDVIRSPVDIYKQFAACMMKDTEPLNEERRKLRSTDSEFIDILKLSEVTTNQAEEETPKIKNEPKDDDLAKAKTEVKQMLDNMFGSKSSDNVNVPDPLPEGNFVDTHQPKKRISLFKQRRQMKSQ